MISRSVRLVLLVGLVISSVTIGTMTGRTDTAMLDRQPVPCNHHC